MSQFGKHTILGRERLSLGLNYKVTTTTEQKINTWQQNTTVNKAGHLGYFKILAKIEMGQLGQVKNGQLFRLLFPICIVFSTA